MSAAYYIIVNDDVDFDTYVSGKLIAQLAEKLNQFCISNNIKPLDFYLHQDFSEFLEDSINEDIEIEDEAEHTSAFDQNDMFSNTGIDEQEPLENDDNISDAPEQEEVWFDPEKGIEWVETLTSALQTQSPDFLNTDLIGELLEYKDVLRKTQKAGLLWHLEMDY